MVNGLNQPVEQKNGRYEVAEIGFSGVFAGRDSREVDAEKERARRSVSGTSVFQVISWTTLMRLD